MNPLNAYLAQSVLQDRYAQAEAYRRAHPRRPAEAPADYDSVTIRRVTADDREAVARLAQLEGSTAPPGAALLAEVEGRVLAAIFLAHGATVADPFHPTAELVRLLEARARQLGSGSPGALARPLRRAAARVTAIARR